MAGTLFLLFKIGDDRYALEASRVVAVLPLLPFKPVPGAPGGIAGVVNYHGAAVPVVDLQAMLLGLGTAPRLSTRLFVIHYRGGKGSKGEKNVAVPERQDRPVALMAGMATESIRLNRADFQPAGVTGASCLGPVIALPRRIVQEIEPEAILTPEVRERLWAAMAAAGEAAP